jgi:hypothetical protein
MKQKAITLFLLPFLALLSSSGCSHWAELIRVPVREVSASQIIIVLEKNRSGLKSFWGEAKIKLRSSRSVTAQPINQRLLAGILFRSPAQMRVEVYAGLGTNILAFVQRGSQLDVFLPKSKLLLSGDIRTDPLSQAIGIDGLLDMILETFGSHQLNPQDLLSFQRKDDEYILCFQKNDCREKYCVDGRTLRIVQKEVFDTGGKLRRRAIFKNYIKISGISLPRQAEFFSDGFQIKVKFIRQKINLKIGEEKFKLKVPAGTRRVSI